MDVFDLQAKVDLNIADYVKKIKEASESNKQLDKAADTTTAHTKALETQLDLIGKDYLDVKDKVKKLSEEFNKSAEETGTASEETRKLSRELKEAEKEASNLEKEANRLHKELDKEKQSADEATDETKKFGNEVKDTGEKAEKAESRIGKLADTMKNALVAGAKTAAAAIGAGATAIGKVITDSVGAYGEYEQLVGGAQKIFDEMDYSIIANDAAKAYRELNMSASEYLESINLAGATFAQTMGDQKGYDTARKGMLAIADFASGTGKSVDELTTKFQMITRSASSYQSIADQFAGILPQTSSDFLEQAQQVGLLSTEYEKLTEVPVAEYQQAVTEMLVRGVDALNLSNNTARESTETLTGSLAMAKKAWENLVVGFSDPDADLGQLIDNFFDSGLSAFENIEPTIEKALGGVGAFVEKAAPIISDKLPPIIEKILPSLLTTGAVLVTSIGKGVAKALPSLLESGQSIINEIMPEIGDALGINIDFSDAKGKIGGLVDSVKGAIEAVQPIVQEAINLLKPIAEFTISEGASTAIGIITAGFNGLSEVVETLSPVLTPLWEHVLKPMGEWTGGVVGEAIERMNQALEGLNIILTTDGVGDLIATLATNFDKVGEKVGACTLAFGILKNGVKDWLAEAGMKLEVKLPILRGCFVTLKNTVGDLNDVLLWMGGYVADCVRLGWDSITDGVNNFFDAVRLGWDSISDTVDKIINFAEMAGGSVFDAFHDEDGSFKIPFKFAANGATLTNGQAIIAEAGPELLSVRNGVATVTPIGVNSSNSPVGGGMTVNINFGGVQVASDYDVDRMTDRAIQKLSEKLASLSVRQQRSVGGVGW